MCLAAALLAAVIGCATPSILTATPGAHGILQSRLSREDAVALQQEADRTVKGICDFLSLPTPEIRAEIMLFDSRRALRRHLAASCPMMTDAAAACSDTPDGTLVVAFSRHRKRGETTRLLRHELSHYVVASHFEDIPPWIDEGLAQYFEAGLPFGQDNDKKRKSIARQLKGDSADAIASLIAVSPGTRLNRKQYALAWGMTRHLLDRGPDGRVHVKHYLETVHSGADPIEQVITNFGLAPDEIRALLIAEMTCP